MYVLKNGQNKPIYWSVLITNGNAAISGLFGFFFESLFSVTTATILKEFISMLTIFSKFRKIVHEPAKVCTFQTKDSPPCSLHSVPLL